jgi:ferredoxin-NADP reductase
MSYAYRVATTKVINNILFLTLKPRNNQDHFAFAPGQYVSISFKRNGRPTPVRCFSIASSPLEDSLQLAMRVHGRFTKHAAALQIDDEVRVNGPFGDFTFSKDDRQIVMLGAGIGITPFISMARYAAESHMSQRITLLFTNRAVANAPFAEELVALQRTNTRFRTYFFETRSNNNNVQTSPNAVIFKNSITHEYLQRITSGGFKGSTYFICGPKDFSKAMRKGLRHEGVDESRIVSESFSLPGKRLRIGSFGIQPLTYGLTTMALVLMTGCIMFVSRGGHHAARAQTPIAPASSSAESTTTSHNATSTSSSAASSTSTNTSSSDTSNSQDTSTQTYQQPVSSVS